MQLATLLRRRIADGTYAPGYAVPSETHLSAEHRVGVSTVRRAMALLRAEGLVEVRAGYGTQVAIPDDGSDLPTQSIQRGARFTVRPATHEEQDTLGLIPGERVLVVRVGARTRVFAAERSMFTTT